MIQTGGTSPPSRTEALDPTRLSLSLSEQRYLAGPLVQPRLNGWDFPDRLRAVVPPRPYPASAAWRHGCC